MHNFNHSLVSRHKGLPFWLMWIVALCLTILPLSPKAALWMPFWVLGLLMVRVLKQSLQGQLLLVAITGLVLDLLHGNLLGTHVIALVIPLYFLGHYSGRIRSVTVVQQAVWIGILSLVYAGVLYWIIKYSGIGTPKILWPAVVTTALIWPWIAKCGNTS